MALAAQSMHALQQPKVALTTLRFLQCCLHYASLGTLSAQNHLFPLNTAQERVRILWMG